MSPLTGDRGRLQGPHLSFRMRQHGVHSCGTCARSSALYPLLRDWRGGGRFDVCWIEVPRLTPSGSFGPSRVPRPWHAYWHAWRRIQRVNMYVAVPLWGACVKLGWYRSRLLDCWNALALLLSSWQCPPSHPTVPTPCVSTHPPAVARDPSPGRNRARCGGVSKFDVVRHACPSVPPPEPGSWGSLHPGGSLECRYDPTPPHIVRRAVPPPSTLADIMREHRVCMSPSTS